MYSSRLFQSFDELIKIGIQGFFPGVEKKENERERKITYSTAKCAADGNSGSDSGQTFRFSRHLWNTCFSGRFWDSYLLSMCVFCREIILRLPSRRFLSFIFFFYLENNGFCLSGQGQQSYRLLTKPILTVSLNFFGFGQEKQNNQIQLLVQLYSDNKQLEYNFSNEFD